MSARGKLTVPLGPVLTAMAILAGFIAPRFVSGRSIGGPPIGPAIWWLGLLFLGTPVVLQTVRGMVAGRFAADLVAALAIVGAALWREPLVGLVIVLMQTGGEALERYAAGRATNAVAELEAEAPRTAHRVSGDEVDEIPVGEIAIGDRVLVRPNEMIPCDGIVREGQSQLDTSRVSGEPLPSAAAPGTVVSSGVVNLDGPLVIEATAVAATSLYARVVELVRTAQASKAPLQRLADRAAVWFTPATLVFCALAYLVSGDSARILAVLVVATPCPLILAVPVAVLGGINRAARRFIVVRSGAGIERLASVDTVIFDKTGTITIGSPSVAGIEVLPPFAEGEVIAWAAAVEQLSSHLLARTFVGAAVERVGTLPAATNVVELAGRGVTGIVAGHRVTVGAQSLLREIEPVAAAEFPAESSTTAVQAYIAIDGRAAGIVTYADRVRPEAPAVVRMLARLGLTRQLLLSGDRATNVAAVASAVGIPEAMGDLLPQDKVAHVTRLTHEGRKVLMVGDGANDAPALSAATVGIAMAARTRGISAEAADVVLLSDDLRRIPDALAISRRTMRVARQSVGVGIGLSVAAMVFAAAGRIAPLQGALLQELLDAAVILNALRALRPSAEERALARR